MIMVRAYRAEDADDVVRCLLALAMGLAASTALTGCASTFTSIQRESDGRYVITGVEAPGPSGFVWIGDYDPKTKTFTVKEELPR
jgi:hypothetical protein